jgi:hypothetical protein
LDMVLVRFPFSNQKIQYMIVPCSLDYGVHKVLYLLIPYVITFKGA